MKEYKKLDWSAVRAVCIKHNLYGKGTNEEYHKLGEFVESIKKDHIDILDMKIIAQDIIDHSYNLDEIKRSYGYSSDEELLVWLVNELNYSTRVWID